MLTVRPRASSSACAECFPLPRNLTCPRTAWVNQIGSYMYPSSFGDLNTQFVNMLDGNSATHGIVSHDNMPYVMFDLGFERTDVRYVNLTARASSDWGFESQMLSVYLSNTKPFINATGSTLCRANITFASSEQLAVACPLGMTARYVTVIRSNTNMVRHVLGCGTVQHHAAQPRGVCALAASQGHPHHICAWAFWRMHAAHMDAWLRSQDSFRNLQPQSHGVPA